MLKTIITTILLILASNPSFAQLDSNLVKILDEQAQQIVKEREQNDLLRTANTQLKARIIELDTKLKELEKEVASGKGDKKEIERLQEVIRAHEGTIKAKQETIEERQKRIDDMDKTIKIQREAIAVVNATFSNEAIKSSVAISFISSTKTTPPYKYGDKIAVQLKGLARIEVSFQGANVDNRSGTFGFDTRNQNCTVPTKERFILKSGTLSNSGGKITVNIGTLKESCKGDHVLVLEIPESSFSMRIPITLE